jgi:hypothetical protein
MPYKQPSWHSLLVYTKCPKRGAPFETSMVDQTIYHRTNQLIRMLRNTKLGKNKLVDVGWRSPLILRKERAQLLSCLC